jgi:hypothetical protein
MQTVTPLPGSAQVRVQQPVEPEQGLPSWTQPPFGRAQRPASDVVLERSQVPEQQSVPL